LEPRLRIDRNTSAVPVHTEVQVWRRAPGVTGIADETDLIACAHPLARADVLAVEVCVVQLHVLAVRPHPDHLAADRRVTHGEDHAVRRGQHGGSAWREDVDALVSPPAAPRIAPHAADRA